MGNQSTLWIVVGLGNPGPRYQGNRHNVGFMVVDLLRERGEDLLWRPSERFSCELAEGQLGPTQVVLVKPQTYMNLSGTSAGPLARFYNAEPERVVVIHDDVDLDLGRLKVKTGGGDGGHKGLRSLSHELGSSDYLRVRFGVGRPDLGDDVTDHVLADFTDEEREAVADQIERAAGAVTTIMREGMTAAMNRYNTAPKPKKTEETEKEQPEQEQTPNSEQADN
jgi:PTH1 family peptidyl-tRNA hydrolase